MSLPEIVSREEWIRARVALLEREKALTRARDGLAAERRRLPMVEVTEAYRFIAADGRARHGQADHDPEELPALSIHPHQNRPKRPGA